MNERNMEMLKEAMCHELDEIAEKGELSAGDLEAAHKLTDTIKNIQKIKMLEYADGYSGDDDMNGRSYRGGYGNSYDYRRRDSMGRYSGNDNYSGRRSYVRGYYRDGIKDKLEELMNEAGTERERKAIQRCVESME